MVRLSYERWITITKQLYELSIITVYTYYETCEWQGHMSLGNLCPITNWYVSHPGYFQGKYRIHEKHMNHLSSQIFLELEKNNLTAILNLKWLKGS